MLLDAIFRVDVRAKNRTVYSAITHLLNKALPQRCQIRNLKEIVCGYMKTYPGVRVFMSYVCSLVNVSDVSDLVEHQHLLFILLKYFVVRCVDTMPALRAHLQQRCNWAHFRSVVTATCERVRELVSQNLERAEYALLGVDTVVRTIARTQSRNTLMPCMATLLNHVEQTMPRATRYLTAGVPLRDARDMLTTRLLENYGMSIFGAFSFRHACSTYMQDGHKNPLSMVIASLCAHDVRSLRGVLGTIAEQRELSMLRASWRTSIRLCVCTVCYDVKNTCAPFTTLRDVVYDSTTRSVCCVKKRNALCRATPLLQLSLNERCVYVGDKAYGVCDTCATLVCILRSHHAAPRRCKQCAR